MTRLRAACLAVALSCPAITLAQATPQAVVRVRVATAAGPAAGVAVSAGRSTVLTSSAGEAELLPAPGPLAVTVRRLGLLPDSASFEVRPGMDTTLVFVLREQAATLQVITVSSTRTERRLEDVPLRVEVLAGEDVGEKTQMHPADLRVLLTEMPGVRVQTTSPSLGGATVRIQGLRGRYTQVLTDGLPLYGTETGSFGLLQVPPLDLRQAEVIKGAASALYGPGAMGGVLNLISRLPTDSTEALANQSARHGTDIIAFGGHLTSASRGITILMGAHRQEAVDVDGDGWADLPGIERLEVRPRLFLGDSAGHRLMLTAGAFAERRGGGSSRADNPAGAFPESLTTRHADVGGVFATRISPSLTAAARIAANVQQHARRFGTRRELDRSATLFGEATSTLVAGDHTLLAGIAGQFERYRNADVPRFDESRSTPAVFVQHTWTPARWLSTQLNARCDASSRYGTICAPRLSLLARPAAALSARFSAGTGWSAPSARTEETDVFGLAPVAGPLRVSAERSRGASLDMRAVRGPLELGASLFTSTVSDPVGVRRIAGDTTGMVELVNAAGPALAHGAELYAVYNAEPIQATAFYSATRTRETSTETGQRRESPCTPRETAGVDVAFDEDESGTRVGVEAFLTGRQSLQDNPYRSVAPAFVTLGILVSQRLGRATAYVNLDNLTNVRQSRFDPLLRRAPGDGGRWTVDAWAPLEGRSLNGGVRWSL